jgi:hypothetical protein
MRERRGGLGQLCCMRGVVGGSRRWPRSYKGRTDVGQEWRK